MNKIHLILQAKGGCGKSHVAILLAQYLEQKAGVPPVCFDIDQENQTFAAFKALNVKYMKLVNDERLIEREKFDDLLNECLSTDSDVVVDTGANSFSAFVSYMSSFNVIDLLSEYGKEVVIHTIIGGGDLLAVTTAGFIDLANTLDCKYVVYLNEHFGSTDAFLESKAFKKFENKIVGSIVLNKLPQDLGAKDFGTMMQRHLTFNEITPGQTPGFNTINTSRLMKIKTQLFSQFEDELKLATNNEMAAFN